MKRIVCAVVLLFVCVAVIFVPKQKTNADFLRIHIRADSNSQADQAVKYLVKDAVVAYLAPHLSNATTKQRAMEIVSNHLSDIKSVCDQVLQKQGKSYLSNVKLCRESFPDRSYGDVTLCSGVYDALIVELGSGSGNNWWCVVYPPLCFVEGAANGTQSITYKSKLLEIIRQWKASHQ